MLNFSTVAMQRNARQQFKFSDGTVIPKGAKVGSPTLITHFDPEVYENPEIFDPLRSYKEAREQGTAQKTILTTGPSFNVFGAGRHPWCVPPSLTFVVLSSCHLPFACPARAQG